MKIGFEAGLFGCAGHIIHIQSPSYPITFASSPHVLQLPPLLQPPPSKIMGKKGKRKGKKKNGSNNTSSNKNDTTNASSFSCTKEKLIADSMKAIQERCLALGSTTLSDANALALSTLMAAGDVAVIPKSKYDAIMAQISICTVAQLNMLLGMANMMHQKNNETQEKITETKDKETEHYFHIVDSHVHFSGPHLSNAWVDNDLNSDSQKMHPNTAVQVERDTSVLLEPSIVSDIEAAMSATTSSSFRVDRMVFVECGNDNGSIEEVKWALNMAKDSSSRIAAVVAHIPIPDGEEAVREFMQAVLLDKDDASDTPSLALPAALRGGRVVLLGNPMPAADACLSCKYDAGLAVLEEYCLHWEWCCHSSALPSVAQACAKRPKMTFVLDHLGRNGGTEEDFDSWKEGLALVAKESNVMVKIGAIEEWGVKDPHPLLDVAVELFGFQRLMFESNWFVSKACGFTYEQLVSTTKAAMERNGATKDDLLDVFCRNAEKVYRL